MGVLSSLKSVPITLDSEDTNRVASSAPELSTFKSLMLSPQPLNTETPKMETKYSYVVIAIHSVLRSPLSETTYLSLDVAR